ncbi:MAG: hypothetical protein ABSA59_24625 [Terriglobia bacterium]|jgi:hypothetical protein
MRKRITIVASLLVALAAGLAYGQSGLIVAKVNIPFNFMAGGKELPVGEYTIQKDADEVHIILRDGAGHGAMLFVIARIARTDSKRSAGAVLFDTVSGQKFLSEVWPSDGDGYLVHAQNGENGQ